MHNSKITLVIASENKAKVMGLTRAFYAMFPEGTHTIIQSAAPSGVSEQPKTEYETIKGALNRLEFIKNEYPEADYYMSMEAGVIKLPGMVEEIGYVYVYKKGDERPYHAQIPRFEVPTNVAIEVRNGLEMGLANDKVFGRVDSKQSGGVVGEVTDGLVTRTNIIQIAAVIALGQMKNNHLYFEHRKKD